MKIKAVYLCIAGLLLVAAVTGCGEKQSKSVQKQVLEERWGIKKHVISIFLVTLPRKRNFLAVQGEFGRIIDVVQRKICFLTVYPVRDPKEKSLTW